MKVRFLFTAMLFAVIGLQNVCAQTMVVTLTDSSKVEFNVSKIKEVVFKDEDKDEHEWVDLGLPSGTKWATCNVGASKPEEYGDHISWGETEPKDSYFQNTYKWWVYGLYNKMTKYCTISSDGYKGFTDGLTELLPEDDAAAVNWGGSWRMPSRTQFEELFNDDYTTTEWTQENGVNGRRVTSKINGKSLFMPAAGESGSREIGYVGSGGYYWTRSLNTDYNSSAYYMTFDSSDIVCRYCGRNFGHTVRPVCP